MGYIRLFIELQREDTGEAAGQARIEMQDHMGRIDIKVRAVLMGLAEGEACQAALVCEHMGRYREYPAGQCSANARGQASLLYRAGISAEPGDALSVGNFKAIVARSGGKRIVGYRSERLVIPDSYEEPVRPQPAEPEPIAEAVEAAEEQSEPVSTWEEPPVQAEVAEMPEPASEEIEEEKPSVAMAANAGVKTAPLPIYVLQDLEQVAEVCGDAGKRAFDRYHHLILIRQGEESRLGMPCRYRSSQQAELEADGYTEFMTPHGGAPSYGEFGYWMKKLS